MMDPTDLPGVFATHRRALQRAAQKILGNSESAEDLVQDACLKAIESLGTHAVQHPLSYALRTVRNLAIDRYRRDVFEARLFDDADKGLDVAAPAGTPETQAIDRQQLALVASALDALPARDRRIFEHYRLEGLTQREIAELYGISPTLVNFVVRDALTHCREALRQA